LGCAEILFASLLAPTINNPTDDYLGMPWSWFMVVLKNTAYEEVLMKALAAAVLDFVAPFPPPLYMFLRWCSTRPLKPSQIGSIQKLSTCSHVGNSIISLPNTTLSRYFGGKEEMT
jgi:hypothetical protein